MESHASAPIADKIPEIGSLDREALREAAEAHDLDLVVLFGSTVRGRRRADSDLDVAIRFAGLRRPKPTLEEEARVADALFDVLQPRSEPDIVVLNRASPLLKWNVARYGIPLFHAAPAVWTLFRIHARHEYEDNARFRERRWQRLLRRVGHDSGRR
jgi:predicted nucleotidyltransferase